MLGVPEQSDRPWSAQYAATFDPVQTVVATARQRLLGVRRSYRFGAHDVSLVLTDIQVSGSAAGWYPGQYETLELTARDVDLATGRIGAVRVQAGNLHLGREGNRLTVVSAPVRWELSLSPEEVQGWISRVRPDLYVTLDGDALVVRRAGRLRWLSVVVAVAAKGTAVEIKPRAVRLGSWRWSIRWPSRLVPLPGLRGENWVSGIAVTTDELTVTGVLAEHQRAMTRADVDRLVNAVKNAVGRITL
jgi:hypothetical protein